MGGTAHLIAAMASTGRGAEAYQRNAATPLPWLTGDAHGGMRVVPLPDDLRKGDKVQEEMSGTQKLEHVGEDVERVAAAWKNSIRATTFVLAECTLDEFYQALCQYKPAKNAVLSVYLSGHGFLVDGHRLFALSDGLVDVGALERYLVERPGFDSVLLLDCCEVGAPPLPRGVECDEAIHVTVAAAQHGLPTTEGLFRKPLVRAMEAGAGVALSDVVAWIRRGQTRTVVTSEDKVLLCMAHALPMRAVEMEGTWRERRSVAHALFKQYQESGTVDLSMVCKGDWRGAVVQAAMDGQEVAPLRSVLTPLLPPRRTFVSNSAVNTLVLPRGHECIGNDASGADMDLLARKMGSLDGSLSFFAVNATGECDDDVRPPRGVGKTAVALEAAHRLVERGLVERVLWCDATSAATFDASLRAARDELGLPDTQSLWKRSGRWLLVLDGADFEVDTAATIDDVFRDDTALSSALHDAEYTELEDVMALNEDEVKEYVTQDTVLVARLMGVVHALCNRPKSAADVVDQIKACLPTSGHGCVLVTSRRTDLGELHPDVEHVRLAPLKADGADAFLEQLCTPHHGTTTHAEAEARRCTAAQLHGLPLAMELAAAYVRQGGTFVAWTARFAEEHRAVVRSEHEGEEEVCMDAMVRAAFETSMGLNKRASKCKDVMKALAVCAPDAIPLEIVMEVCVDAGASAGAEAKAEAEAVVETLADFALVHYDDARRVVYVHRLVQQVVRGGLAARRGDSVKVASWLVRAWEWSKDAETRLFPHAMHVLASCRAEDGAMLALAEQCAAVLRGRGADCVRVQRRIVHLVHAIAADEHAQVLQQKMLGVDLCRVGQLDEGHALLQKTVDAMNGAEPTHKAFADARIEFTIAHARKEIRHAKGDAAFAEALRLLRSVDTTDARVRREIASVTVKRVRAQEERLPPEHESIAEARVERALAEVDVLVGNVPDAPDNADVARLMLQHACERLRGMQDERAVGKRRELEVRISELSTSQ